MQGRTIEKLNCLRLKLYFLLQIEKNDCVIFDAFVVIVKKKKKKEISEKIKNISFFNSMKTVPHVRQRNFLLNHKLIKLFSMRTIRLFCFFKNVKLRFLSHRTYFLFIFFSFLIKKKINK